MSTLHGKVCLVTGSTSGIGEATAMGLAKLGARVVMLARDEQKAAQTKEKITRATDNRDVEILLCDLSSQASIRAAAAELKARHDRLHVLVNQAGLVNNRRTLTVDGIETTFAVNYLSYYLLTLSLLDVLKASSPARVINSIGGVEAAGKIDFEDLSKAKKYSWFSALAQSKLADVLFSYELARRLEGTGVTVNCINPNGTKTSLGKNTNGVPALMMKLFRPFFQTAEQAAAASVRLATDPALAAVTGKVFVNMKEGKTSPRSHDRALAAKLWDVSAQLTGLA